MYNKVVLVGNLTRDIEVRNSQSGSVVANSAIATSRKFKGQNGEQKEEVCFIDITFFGRTAEIAQQYLRKGSKLLIEGRLVFDQWVDQNGQKMSKHSVAVETMQMLDNKESSKENGTSYPQNVGASGSGDTHAISPNNPTYSQKAYETRQDKPQTYAQKPQQTPPPIDFEEEDIPF